jgi:hypothetical protein
MFFVCFSYLYVIFRSLFHMFFVCVSSRYYFVFFITIFEENRQNVCVITGFCWQTLSASNTMAVCYLLRSFKCQKGQGSAVMSIYVYFVLFRIVFRIFVDFFVFVDFISFFCKSFRILFRICTHDRQKWTTHMDFISYLVFRMVFLMYFVCFSYCFVCFWYFIVSRILMERPTNLRYISSIISEVCNTSGVDGTVIDEFRQRPVKNKLDCVTVWLMKRSTRRFKLENEEEQSIWRFSNSCWVFCELTRPTWKRLCCSGAADICFG